MSTKYNKIKLTEEETKVLAAALIVKCRIDVARWKKEGARVSEIVVGLRESAEIFDKLVAGLGWDGKVFATLVQEEREKPRPCLDPGIAAHDAGSMPKKCPACKDLVERRK